jgi:potassium-dependent mechanosensitive channel
MMARLAAALFMLIFLCVPAFALDEAAAGQAERAAAAFRTELQQIKQAIGSPATSDNELTDFRSRLDDISRTAQAQSNALDSASSEVQEQIAKLGAPPAPGQAESAEIAAQRKLLNDVGTRVSGAKAQLQLVAVEAEQASGDASIVQRDRFFKRIFEPSRSILNPALWAESARGVATTAQRVGALLSTWWGLVQASSNWVPLVALLLVLVLLAIIWRLAGRVWRTRFEIGTQGQAPDNLTRLWFVIWSVGATFFGSILVTLVVFSLLEEAGLLTQRFELLLSALARFAIGSVVTAALAYRLAAPASPEWRVIDLGNQPASRFALLGGLSAVLASFYGAFRTVADGVYLPVSNSVAISAIASGALCGLLAWILRTFQGALRREQAVPATRNYFNWAAKLQPLLWVMIGVSAFALLLGYVALADYLLFRLFDTAVLVAVLFVIQYAGDAAAQSSADASTRLGHFVRRFSGWTDRAIERGGLAIRTLIDIFLVLFGFSTLVSLWAVAWIDFRSLANRVFFSFELGNVTISPWSILLVTLTLIAGVMLTKVFVGWLDRRILTRVRLERGVQDSVRTGIKYAGYVLAAGFALSAAGINFSNLALVAGAFGVGIGFGLQSIVNNFVSGLILLAERPVRVGDWIVTNAGEGLVKRINVRSTEIETFDGCSIIVPNSTLITEPVRNWTLGNTAGRVGVSVSLPYSEDAEKTTAMLLKIITSNANVLNYPEPQVLLSRFGAYALEFDVKFSVANIFEGAIIASDIRIAILQALAEKGISIPVPTNISVVK